VAEADSAPTKFSEKSEAYRRVRGKAYARARAHWQSVGDHAKASLTDDQLDDQFQWFDAEGIPRLKSELSSLEPPIGSLAYAAKMAREADIHTANPIDPERADDILAAEFPNYLLNRMKGKDADANESTVGGQ
jgi:hypothetical protein